MGRRYASPNHSGLSDEEEVVSGEADDTTANSKKGMDGTPPVGPLVPEARFFFVFFSEHVMGLAHDSTPVLTPCPIWWVLEHNLPVNNRYLVYFCC